MVTQPRITLQEAALERCCLCHRRLLERPGTTPDQITRLPRELHGGLAHESCAVLAGVRRRSPPGPAHGLLEGDGLLGPGA